jgi:chemotaxis protein MotB
MNETEPVPDPNLEQTEPIPLKKTFPRPVRLRERPSSSDRGNDLWLLSLSDLLMLLMVFFVVLFGMTLGRKTHPEAIAKTVTDNLPEIMAIPGSDQISETGLSTAMAEQDPFSGLESDLQSAVTTEPGGEQVTVAARDDHLVLLFPEKILFDPGQAGVRPSVKPILEQVGALIQNHPDVLVEVQGHTDNRPIRSVRYPSNWELSVDRATQVAKALIHQGVNPAQVSVKGYGEYRPLLPNDSDEARFRNRRVEVLFFPHAPGIPEP